MQVEDITHSATTTLQQALAERIIAHVRAEGMAAGSPLRESLLSRHFSVSRTPMRAAMNHLCKTGVLEHIPHRGYFLKMDAATLPAPRKVSSVRESEQLYDAIIGDYFQERLPHRVSEAELLRRYRTERSTLQEALARLSMEGILKPNPGYGWQFEPLLRTREADDESYRYRLILEPAGLREPTFRADPDELQASRDAQETLISRLPSGVSLVEVFRANAEFHEMLARFSGNRFILQSIEHQGRLRRLLEYRNYQDWEHVAISCREHIAIIDALLSGNREGAASLMVEHIEGALRAKPAFSSHSSGAAGR